MPRWETHGLSVLYVHGVPEACAAADRESPDACVLDPARTLRLRIVAQGVETPLQLEALRRLGLDEVQGFLIGRPHPAGSVPEMLCGLALPPRQVA